MAKDYNGGAEIRTLEKKINDFAYSKGKQKSEVFNNLLDYICGYLDPTGTPIKGWTYKGEENVPFYEMMAEYFRIMGEMLEKKLWYDCWGDLFMSLTTNGGGKGQFFTPCDMCNMMAEITIRDNGSLQDKGQQTRFGKRIVVNDCACGSSRNLLAAAARIEYLGERKPYLVAEDVDMMCCKMSAINMAVHGCYGEVICHNTIADPLGLDAGWIINETCYPFPTNIPSIRPCSDRNMFYGTSDHPTKEKIAERKFDPKSKVVANNLNNNSDKPMQLSLF